MRFTAALALTVFVAAAVVLFATVPTLYAIAERNSRTGRSAVADACAVELTEHPHSATVLDALRARYPFASITVSSGAGGAGGRDTERRAIPAGVVEVRFTGDLAPSALRATRFAAAAAILAGIAAVVLTATGMGTVMRSPEQERHPLGAGAAGSNGVVPFGTFEISIRTMKQRESELRQLHDREKGRADELAIIASTLVRSLSSGFIAIDEHGKLLDLNTTARELLGIAPEMQPAGKDVIDAIGDSAFARTLSQAAASHATLQREEVAQSEDGTAVIGLTTVPLAGADDHYFGLLALFTDLAPVRRLESRVREMQSLADLGEMSTGIAHEFRNSLATVLGYLRLARKEPLPATAGQRLSNAEAEAQSLNDAVEKLLAFSRPIALEPKPLALRTLLEDVIERFREVNPAVEFDICGEEVTVAADAALLSRAFDNIVRNAVESIAEKRRDGGRVDVFIRANPTPQVTIRDDGVGLDEADAARLQLPFQSGKVKGYGLGLALVRKIVILHGGSLRLNGTPGEGASVTVELLAMK